MAFIGAVSASALDRFRPASPEGARDGACRSDAKGCAGASEASGAISSARDGACRSDAKGCAGASEASGAISSASASAGCLAADMITAISAAGASAAVVTSSGKSFAAAGAVGAAVTAITAAVTAVTAAVAATGALVEQEEGPVHAFGVVTAVTAAVTAVTAAVEEEGPVHAFGVTSTLARDEAASDGVPAVEATAVFEVEAASGADGTRATPGRRARACMAPCMERE